MRERWIKHDEPNNTEGIILGDSCIGLGVYLIAAWIVILVQERVVQGILWGFTPLGLSVVKSGVTAKVKPMNYWYYSWIGPNGIYGCGTAQCHESKKEFPILDVVMETAKAHNGMPVVILSWHVISSEVFERMKLLGCAPPVQTTGGNVVSLNDMRKKPVDPVPPAS